MIKRQDLVSQFELVVRQEIKNHNSAIAASNENVEKMRRTIRDNQDDVLARLAALASRLGTATTRITDIEDSIKGIVYRLESIANDALISVDRSNSLLSEMKSANDVIRESVASLQALYHNVLKDQESLRKEIANYRLSFSHEIEQMHKKMVDYVQSELNTIKECPKEAHKIKSELESRIACKEVDTKGVVESINATRKDFEYLGKKIEDLYIQLSRLQKRVQ